MNQPNSSKQILLSVIGVAILVVAVVGVSFAFFNYTRTGGANTIKTGTIVFEADYTGIDVTNLFPVARDVALSYNADEDSIVGVTTLTINGYTTYANGLDYLITATSVDFNASYEVEEQGQMVTHYVALPVSINVTANNLLGTATTLTAGVDTVTTAPLGGTNVDKISVVNYEVDQTTKAYTALTNNAVLAKGHLATNTDLTTNAGVITIKAYIDTKKVAITDTYNGTNTPTDAMGTTSSWVDGRTVLTTEQWNSLSTGSGASFKIRVEANETPAS